jgi:hypothetical protein
MAGVPVKSESSEQQRREIPIQEELYDFGTAVDATPPPSDHVFDATKVTSNALKQGLGG